MSRFLVASVLSCAAFIRSGAMRADVVPVRHAEGVVHGFLTLRTMEGETLADGDLIQRSRGNRVTSRLVFHFRDGSVQDETVVFTQRRTFQLVSDHLVQKGPAFPHPMDVSVDARSGQVTVRATDKEGKEEVFSERLAPPPDAAPGLVATLLKNVRPGAGTTLSIAAPTPKPRLVKLVIAAAGEEPFSIGASSRKAVHYVVKVEIGGVAGLLAPLVGKQPPDTHVWILEGDAPAFVKSEGPLYMGGPSWRIELTNPTWPEAPAPTPAPQR